MARALLRIGTHLGLGTLYLAALLLVAIPPFVVLTVAAETTDFLAYAAVVGGVIVLACVACFAVFPVLASERHRRAQDIAFLLAGLITLTGLLDVHHTGLERMTERVGQQVSAAEGYIQNLRDLGPRAECEREPSRAMCHWYAEAYAMGEQRAPMREWGAFADRLLIEFRLTGGGDLNKAMETRDDLTPTDRQFIGRVFLIAAAGEERNRLDEYAWWIRSLDQPFGFRGEDARLFGGVFLMITFGIGLSRTAIKGEEPGRAAV
jgi:hypothetical protein